MSYIIENPSRGSNDVEIIISFLSPITPTSTLRQSIPASYVTFYVTTDIDVAIYVDLNGQWVSGDRGSEIVWNINHQKFEGEGSGIKTWQFRRAVEQQFTEFRDQAEWGTLHFSAPMDVNHEAGNSYMLRQRFASTGTLQNQVDNEFRAIMDGEPVFAFSKTFKANASSRQKIKQQSVTFTIAHIQDPIIQFAAARGMTLMKPLWKSYLTTEEKLLEFHYLDFGNATELANKYSQQLAVDAYKSGADDYVDIVAVSARQVMGATHFVGTPEDPLLFLKEISSDGNTQTIDVIFPAFPFFMYTNPRWLAYLLEPLIEHMLSGQYPNKYAMHDIGSRYPNATGYPDGHDEYMPVEECGNILIMGLALANEIKFGKENSVSSNWSPMGKPLLPSASDQKVFPLTAGKEDGILYIDDAWIGGPQSLKAAERWINRSYRLWKQWTQYLVDFALEPANQLSTDDFAGWLALQTNLALKGIIGIKAMAGLSEIVGNEADAKTYNSIAGEYIAKWEQFGLSRDKTHFKVAYDWWGSWTTIYNLYADSLLCFRVGSDSKDTIPIAAVTAHDGKQKPLHPPQTDEAGFVPKHVYQIASDWYYQVRQKYGLPLDSRHLYTKTDWEFFAMSVAAPKVRAEILESVARWVNETNTDRPLTDLHDTENQGGFPGPNFFARPVIGGHFAPLSLERACGGHAMDGLKFLNDDVTKQASLDVATILRKEKEQQPGPFTFQEDL